MRGFYICQAGNRCKWPRGPVQPAHRFARANGQRWRRCVSCRAYAARSSAAYRQRQLSVVDLPPAPSNADLDPVYAAALRGWLLGLVIRREGHPLTRDIAETAPAAAAANPRRACGMRGCTNVHTTNFKLCPACREKTRTATNLRRERKRAGAAYGSEGK